MLLISDLVNQLDSYLDKESVARIYEAYLFGAEAHEGQKRKTGEPYIYHPIAVAGILANMKCDDDTIVAAILHDVIEDTGVAKEQIELKFGQKVAHMVDGVSKLSTIQNKSQKQAQADNFRKMMLAMSSDIRVVIIKIADRLHNMRTLYGMVAHKRRRISKETLDIYRPLADRLGMHEIKCELETLALQNLHPWRYRTLDNAMRAIRGQAFEKNDKIEKEIKLRLSEAGVDAKLHYREKSLFSIYSKMHHKQSKFVDLDDIFALRIIVKELHDCYKALGIVHGLLIPVLGKFKDYISIPKVNGYQSLHTVLFVKDSYNIEVQIRTEEMDIIAESGVASHWNYKNTDTNLSDISRKWMAEINDLQQTTEDAEEFLESIKFDLFTDRVFVFSPKGKIYELPRGATVLDFAYAVHTEIGDHCHSATINNRPESIGTELLNGQTVHIVTDETIKPMEYWLDVAISGRAISKIKHSLRQLSGVDATKIGEKILLSVLSRQSLEIKTNQQSKLLQRLHITSMTQLFEDIGLGKSDPNVVIAVLKDIQSHDGGEGTIDKIINKIKSVKRKKVNIEVSGTAGTPVTYAYCCMPLPGDGIIGHFSTGIGIVVHQNRCKTVNRFPKQELLTSLRWEDNVSGIFLTEITLKVKNQTGVLAAIATEISNNHANIGMIEFNSNENRNIMKIKLHVDNRFHLATIIKSLRKLPAIMSISRFKNWSYL